MSNILAPHKKKWLSNAVLVGFLGLVGVTAFLSNAFKTPVKSHNEFIEQSLVFNNKELDSVNRLILKNKSGDFEFERMDTAWHMTSPKDMSASSAFIEKLFASLNTIKTKKLLIDDQANNSNFSLDKPTAILTLTNEAGKSIVVSVGIMNTIDSSTYLKISGRNGIYHVEAPSISLENITLADLTKSTVFDFDPKKILSFKIFPRKTPQTAQFEVTKKDGIWVNAEGKTLDTARLEDKLNEFVSIKSSFVLDEPTDTQKKQTNTLLSSGDYVVKITMEDNQVLSYQIGSTTKSLSEVSLNEEPHFVIVEGHDPMIYIIKKDFLNLFEIKNDSLKSLEAN